MDGQTERRGVGGGVAAIVATITLFFGLASGLILGAAGGYVVARQIDSDGLQFQIAFELDGPLSGLKVKDPTQDDAGHDRENPLTRPARERQSEELEEPRRLDEAAGGSPPESVRPETGGGNPSRDGDEESGIGSGGSLDDPTGGLPEGYPGSAPAAVEVRPFIGVRVQTVGLEESAAPQAGGQGALVTEVERDSPAAAAGVLVGDVIVAVDETSIESADDLVEAIATYDVGNAILLTVLREGNEESLDTVLGGRSAVPLLGPMGTLPDIRVMPFDSSDPEIQRMIEQLPPEMKEQLEKILESMESGDLFEHFEPMPAPDALIDARAGDL